MPAIFPENGMWFQFSHDVIDPETQEEIFSAFDAIPVQALDFVTLDYGLDEFQGRVVYAETEEALRRICERPF